MDYHEEAMKIHNFIRWLQMPVAFAAMVTMLILHWDSYKTSVYMAPEAALCIAGLLLIAVTEFGFIYNASYSYFSVQLYFANNVGLSAYFLAYYYLLTDVSNRIITYLALTVLVTFIMFICVCIYYGRRKYLFIESKEEKIIKNAGLKPTKIDFNPQFEREKMSRNELKEHMEKRFVEVEKSVEKKQDEHIEADPFEDK